MKQSIVPTLSASGYGAMGLNTIGTYFTASGYKTLFSNTIGNNNTASGTAVREYHRR